MARRLNLSKTLHELSEHVYYQPGPSVQLVYPCIVYKLNHLDPWHAENDKYHLVEGYTLTVIDRNPDSELRDRVANLRYCRLARTFETENLHHWVFNIYV